MYETISETNFNFLQGNFSPNYFVNISKHMKDKLEIMKIYKSEFKKHPFPRSNDSIKALAILRALNQVINLQRLLKWYTRDFK